MKIKKVAKKLEKMGGKEDTILAHINPEEAAMLKEGGGSGERNPKTGLLSFGGYEGGGTDMDGPSGMDGGPEPGQGFGEVNAGAFGGSNTDAQDAANLAAFDASQPNPLGGGMTATLSALGIPAGLYNALNEMLAGRNQGAGYGATFAGGQQVGGPTGGGMFGGGDTNIGSVNEHGGDSPGGGMGGATTPTTPPPTSMFNFAPITQQPFVSKWGKPRTRGYFGG